MGNDEDAFLNAIRHLGLAGLAQSLVNTVLRRVVKTRR